MKTKTWVEVGKEPAGFWCNSEGQLYRVAQDGSLRLVRNHWRWHNRVIRYQSVAALNAAMEALGKTFPPTTEAESRGTICYEPVARREEAP